MIHTTVSQTATGIRFDGEGFQSLAARGIKDYMIGFQTGADMFRFVFRYLNDQYWMGVDISTTAESIRIDMHEERPSGGVLFGTKEHVWVEGEWSFEAEGEMMYIRKGGTELTAFAYANLSEGGVGLFAKEMTEFDMLWFEQEGPVIGTIEGSGEHRAEPGEVFIEAGVSFNGEMELMGTYTLSTRYSGEGVLRLGTKTMPFSGEGLASIGEVCSGLTEWEVLAVSDLTLTGIQLESGERPNPILANGEVGEKSEVSYPNNDKVREEGTLLMSYEGEGHLFTCGNLTVSESMGLITASIGGTSVSANGTGRFLLSWGEEMRLTSEGTASQQMSDVIVPGTDIILTGDPMNVEMIDEVVIWRKAYTIQEMDNMTGESRPEEKLFEASFEEEVSTKEKTFVEPTMAPVDGSPILVRDTKGALRGTTFFDPDTGEYRMWNEERFLYDGVSDRFVLAYEDLDEQFKVELRHAGETLGAGTVEPPYVRFILSDEEKARLHGEEVSVRYQLARSYFIDYDRAAYDSYRVYLARNQGVEVTVSHEGNRFSKRRLAKEIELNPLETTRSEGFMFVDQEVGQVSSFRVFMEPNRLRADGLSSAELLIQALDKDGTEVIGAELVVEAEEGSIEPLVSREAVRMRNGEGTYHYHYHAPYRKTESEGDIFRTHLLIKDLESGIGARVPVYLAAVKEESRGGEMNIPVAAQRLFTYMAYAYRRKDMPVLSAVLDVNEDGVVNDEELAWLQENLSATEVDRRVKMIEELKANGTIDY